MSQLPDYLNGHVPNGDEKADLIEALTDFGIWVKQTTDQAIQRTEQIAESVHPDQLRAESVAHAYAVAWTQGAV